jgi:predicted nucleotidyltransferase component of viral defense system
LSDKPTLEELLEAQEHFGLPGPALVEKDWYVVKALAAIAAVDTGDLRLVFGGGTALSRAHKLTKRMSEDVDLKIVSAEKPSQGKLRRLRTDIAKALLGAGFIFDPSDPAHVKSMHHSTYTKYQLPYAAITEGKGILRPEIQIETSVWPLRREAVDKPVSSFIAEANGREPELPSITCSSVLETAAEKLVGLTWRAGSELAGVHHDRDPTLVRHIYDLHLIREHYDAAEVAALAREVVAGDVAARGNRFPAWEKDPFGETLRAIEGIPKDKVFSDGYASFVRDMVYGDKPDFATTMGSLKALADHLRKLPT